MNINKTLEDHFNRQLNLELHSSYLYLAMAAYFDAGNLHGFSHWMKVQASEERDHAMKFYEFIVDRGGRVTLDKLDKPQTSWESPLAAFEHTLKHEQEVTASISGIVDASLAQKDHAAHSFLQTLIDEQVEEEAQATDIVQRLKMIGPSTGSLLWMDKELGKRAATA